MRMREFHNKHVQNTRLNDNRHENPLRIINDGHRNWRDFQFLVCFYHRKDTDLVVNYSAAFDPYGHGNGRGSVLDALTYLRRRMAYTQQALRSSGDLETQIANWSETGIRPRLARTRPDQIRRSFAAHRATYIALRDFMGDDILQEFLAVTPEGEENE